MLNYETYIELALWYYNAGLENEAISVMELCPENPIADYLSAYLAARGKMKAKATFTLTEL